jgi:hypothetical protein
MVHFMQCLSLAMSQCVVRQNEKGPTLWGPSRIQMSLLQFFQLHFELQAVGVSLIGGIVHHLGEQPAGLVYVWLEAPDGGLHLPVVQIPVPVVVLPGND